MGRIILEHDRWVVLAAVLSLLELKEAYSLYKEPGKQHRGGRFLLIVSYSLCAVVLPVIVVCDGEILIFALIYFSNKVIRFLALRLTKTGGHNK